MAFAQHDVQELMRVLFEALQLSDTAAPAPAPTSASSDANNDGAATEPAAQSFATLLPQLFSGGCADVLACLSCGHISTRNDVFMDLTLPVTGTAATVTATADNAAAAPPQADGAAPAEPSETAAATADGNTDNAAAASSGSSVTSAEASSSSSPPSSTVDVAPSSTAGPCTPYTSLHRALRSYLHPETLAGPNQWQCSGCGCKVDATKTARLTSLPPILTLHLKRFTFDWRTSRYSKVDAPFSFPFELDADCYLHNEAKAKEAVIAQQQQAASGAVRPESARPAGSARSAVRDLRATRRASQDAEAAAALAALARGEALSDEQQQLLDEYEEEDRKARKQQPQQQNDGGGDGGNDTTTNDVAARPSTAAQPVDAAHADGTASDGYELCAILMHSGSATRGHYFAFVREQSVTDAANAPAQQPPTDASQATSQAAPPSSSWLLVNDTSVLRLTQEEVVAASGADAGTVPAPPSASSSSSITPAPVVDAAASSSPSSGNAKYIPGGGTAYMLIYRRKQTSAPSNAAPSSAADAGGSCAAPTASPSPSSSGINIVPADVALPSPSSSLASQYQYAACMGSGLLPPSVLSELHAENVEWDTLKRLAELRRQLTELTVYVPSLALEEGAGKAMLQAAAGEAATAAKQAESSQPQSLLQPATPSKPITATPLPLPLQGQPLTVFLPLDTSIEAATDAIFNQYEANIRSKAAASVLSPIKADAPPVLFSLPIPARVNVRLRRYEYGMRRALDSFSGTHQAGLSLASAGLGPAATMVLEVRAAGQAAPVAPTASSGSTSSSRRRRYSEDDEDEDDDVVDGDGMTTTGTPTKSKQQKQKSAAAAAAALPGLPWSDWDPEAITITALLWNGNEPLQGKVAALRSVAELGIDAAAAGKQVDLAGLNRSKVVVLDGATAAAIDLPGSPASTVATLRGQLLQSLSTLAWVQSEAKKEALASGGNSADAAASLYLHAVVLPGGLPDPDAIASGHAASRLRARIAPPFTNCTRTNTSTGGGGSRSSSGGLRVISMPLLDAPIADASAAMLGQLLRKDLGLTDGDDLLLLVGDSSDLDQLQVTGTAQTVAAGDGKTAESDAAASTQNAGGTADASAMPESLPQLLPILRSLFTANTIRVNFNLLQPLAPGVDIHDDAAMMLASTGGGSSSSKVKYDLTLTARRDEPLASLKRRMVVLINQRLEGSSSSSSDGSDGNATKATGSIDVSAVHLRRNPRAPQLRDEDRSLKDHDIGDGATFFIAHGAPLPEGAFRVRVHVWLPATAAAGGTAGSDVAANAAAAGAGSLVVVTVVQAQSNQRVATLRKTIHQRLATLAAPSSASSTSGGADGGLLSWLLPPGTTVSSSTGLSSLTPAHLRLRAKAGGTSTGGAGASAGAAILRDDAVLRQALGTAGEGDDRDVVLQVLPEPETIGAGDIVIRLVELVFPDQQQPADDGQPPQQHQQTAPYRLSPYDDLVVAKATTMRQLVQHLAARAAAAQHDEGTGSSGGNEADPLVFVSRIRVAKHSAYGPKLTAWEAANKLKWEGPVASAAAVAVEGGDEAADGAAASSASSSSSSTGWDGPVSGPPLGLRDGYTLVWRRDVPPPPPQAADAGAGTSASTTAAAGDAHKNAASAGKPLKPWLVKGGARSGNNAFGDAGVEVAVPKGSSSGGGRPREVGVSIRVKAREQPQQQQE